MYNHHKDDPLRLIADLVSAHQGLFVITGAGLSTECGIPAYRDEQGNWCASQPVLHQDFIRSEKVRKRYWARSMAGWRYFGSAVPGVSHHALVSMEQAGLIQLIVTQNVDRLHQQAGSQNVLDLHGRLDRVRCLDCARVDSRQAFQVRLEQANPDYRRLMAERVRPDGDAEIVASGFGKFVIPECSDCGGDYKPDVVFYGGAVSANKVRLAYDRLDHSRALLVIGTSLMAYSVYRFCREAEQRGLPVLAINQGVTRHDGKFHLKVRQPCADVLKVLTRLLGLTG